VFEIRLSNLLLEFSLFLIKLSFRVESILVRKNHWVSFENKISNSNRLLIWLILLFQFLHLIKSKIERN